MALHFAVRVACSVSLASALMITSGPELNRGLKTVAEMFRGSKTVSEAEYWTIAAMKNDEAMAVFIKLLLDAEGREILDDVELDGLVPWYSGTQAMQSLAMLKTELSTKKWVVDKITKKPNDDDHKQKHPTPRIVDTKQTALYRGPVKKSADEDVIKSVVEEAKASVAAASHVQPVAKKTVIEEATAPSVGCHAGAMELVSVKSDKSGNHAGWMSESQFHETYDADAAQRLMSHNLVEKRQNPKCPERTQFFVNASKVFEFEDKPLVAKIEQSDALLHVMDAARTRANKNGSKVPRVEMSDLLKLDHQDRGAVFSMAATAKVAIYDALGAVDGLTSQQMTDLSSLAEDMPDVKGDYLRKVLLARGLKCPGCSFDQLRAKVMDTWRIQRQDNHENAKQIKPTASKKDSEKADRSPEEPKTSTDFAQLQMELKASPNLAKAIAAKATGAVQTVVQKAMDAVGDVKNAAGSAVIGVKDAAGSTVNGVAVGVGKAHNVAGNAAMSMVGVGSAAQTGVSLVVSVAANTVANTATSAANTVATTATSAANTVATTATSATRTVGHVASTTGSGVSRAANTVAAGAVQGVHAAGGAVGAAATATQHGVVGAAQSTKSGVTSALGHAHDGVHDATQAASVKASYLFKSLAKFFYREGNMRTIAAHSKDNSRRHAASRNPHFSLSKSDGNDTQELVPEGDKAASGGAAWENKKQKDKVEYEELQLPYNDIAAKIKNIHVVKGFANKPAADQAAELFSRSKQMESKLVFEPGTVGLDVGEASGFVTSVSEAEQAHRLGVRVGMRFLTVAGKPYTAWRYHDAKAGTKKYEVTFAQAVPEKISLMNTHRNEMSADEAEQWDRSSLNSSAESVHERLPNALTVLKRPQHVMSTLTEQLKQLKADLDSEDQSGLEQAAEQKNELEEVLDVQRQNTTEMRRENRRLESEIDDVRQNNDNLRQRAIQLQQYAEEMRVDLRDFQNNLSVAEEYVSKSLQAGDKHEGKLNILRHLELQEAEESSKTAHKQQLSDFDEEPATEVALLQLADVGDALSYVNTIGQRFSDLKQEQEASFKALRMQFDKQLQDETARQIVFLGQQEELKEDKAKAVELNNQLSAAVKHLTKTTSSLEGILQGLRKYSSNVGKEN